MGKVLPFSTPSTPGEEAQQWIIRIDRSKLSATEHAQLHAWLVRDPAHKKLLDHHAKLWHAAGKAKAISRPEAEPAYPSARRSQGRVAAMAAACVAAVVIGFGAMAPVDQVLETPVGQHQLFTMSDGSRIDLNTRSKAKVKYEPEQREILLVEGEGYFDVAKDARRPFTVVAGPTSVRAIGTRFSVHRRPDGQVDVTVHEGVVEVVNRATAGAIQSLGPQQVRSTKLVAGQAAQAKDAGLVVGIVSSDKLKHMLAWQQGRVTFDDIPLSAALAEMSRYAELPMVIGDPGLDSITLSGSFATQNVASFLRTLEEGFDLKVEKRANRYIILPARIKASAS